MLCIISISARLTAGAVDGVGEVVGDVLVSVDAFGEAACESEPQGDVAVDLEEVV